jgi:hypothetical protein
MLRACAFAPSGDEPGRSFHPSIGLVPPFVPSVDRLGADARLAPPAPAGASSGQFQTASTSCFRWSPAVHGFTRMPAASLASRQLVVATHPARSPSRFAAPTG